MPTVIFSCRHCGKEMAAAEESRGQDVRCPHCGEVVQAPGEVAAALPAGEAGDDPAKPRSSDSIFDEPLEGEALGTDSPSTTTVFLPSEGASASPTKIDDPTTEMLVPDRELMTPAASARQVVAQHARRESLLAKYLLAILIPYAILMTVAALWFYQQARTAVHPLEALPDWPRDNDQPARPGGTFQRLDDAGPVPRRLRVGLGRTLRVGDLEVTPLRVERRPVLFRYEHAARQEQQSKHDALVLTLHVRNASADTAFAPNDLFFNRRWREGMPAANRPYTCLEVGPTRFYGGPCAWKPRRPKEEEPREFIAGSEYNKKLEPGTEMDYLVCTDPEDASVLAAVAQAADPLLWRVQVRRGLVHVRDHVGTATAVLGVEFGPQDVRTP